MRENVRHASGVEAARALHRLAFALWRAVFYLQRAPARLNSRRSRSLAAGQRRRPAVCLRNLITYLY